MVMVLVSSDLVYLTGMMRRSVSNFSPLCIFKCLKEMMKRRKKIVFE